MTRPILYLDISRLVRRYEHFGGPTGIDRIEIEYARWLTRQETFEGVPVTRSGKGLLALPEPALRTILEELTRRWRSSAPPGFGREGRSAVRYYGERVGARLARLRLVTGARRPEPGGRRSVYLNVGQDGLDEDHNYVALAGAKAALISDVIPLTHPEYDTPRSVDLHGKRVRAALQHLDHVFTISDATQHELLRMTDGCAREMTTAHLAPALEPPGRAETFTTPTFVHLSTINRRKNLALLLQVWREFAGLPDAPRLAVIGRRGNDITALELIDRCAAIAPLVTLHGAVSDQRAAELVAGAHALLTPSFAEGFGLPIVEAHAMGVPVIASDLACHREIGGDHTPYLNPLDGPSWRDTILDYVRNRQRHEAARAAIRPPRDWSDHFATVAPVLERIAR